MKKFLRHIGLFLLPIVMVGIGLEWGAEAIPNSYTYKRDYIERHGGEVKTLILGSSNAYDGINPTVLPGAFNLANSSQTLEDDYRLLERYIDDMDSLQTVIVGLGYHSLGAMTEDNRRTYYTIYMGLYPRWPISKYSFEVFNLELLTKKIIKYAVSRDVTRCDSLGQRVGHTAEAVKERKEFWNKDAATLAANDRYEVYKNIDKHAYGAINTDKQDEVIKNAHSTSVLSNSPHGLECNQPQVLTSELAAPVIANTPNMPTDESHVECLQKTIIIDNPQKKPKNESAIECNVHYLRSIIELCEKHGVKPVIVTMPVMKEYKEALPKEQVALHDSVMQSMPSSVQYIDASEWAIPDDGWYNATHLTKEESGEFTERVEGRISD